MFGIGKILGNVVGGLLDKIGLGKIAPFVKLGLDALTGNWLGVAEDVFGLVSQFKGNFLDKAATRPPLGNFENPTNQFTSDNKSLLSSNRMSGLMGGLKNLFNGFKSLTNGNLLGGFSKIFNAFQAISEAAGNSQLFNERSVFSQFNNIIG